MVLESRYIYLQRKIPNILIVRRQKIYHLHIHISMIISVTFQKLLQEISHISTLKCSVLYIKINGISKKHFKELQNESQQD